MNPRPSPKFLTRLIMVNLDVVVGRYSLTKKIRLCYIQIHRLFQRHHSLEEAYDVVVTTTKEIDNL